MNALKRVIPLLGCFCAIAYLGFHAWTGDQGLRRSHQINAQITHVSALLDEARQDRQSKEDQVRRLKEGPEGPGIDIDYLEERTRYRLRYAHPDEIVISLDTRVQR